MEELDEILDKEEELYDDVIEKKDKLRYRHPLFVFLAILALLAILFFSIDAFISFYVSWRKKVEMRRQTPTTMLIETVDRPRGQSLFDERRESFIIS